MFTSENEISNGKIFAILNKTTPELTGSHFLSLIKPKGESTQVEKRNENKG